jgi:hypothetical protein
MSADAETDAQAWHDLHCRADDAGWVSSCWCCCPQCDPDWGGENPQWTAATDQMRADR